MAKIERDIAVVGGGLAGLLAACRLAADQHSVALVAPPRRADRRTTALLGASIEALRGLGLWPVLEPLSQPLRAIRIVDGTDRLIRAPEVTFDARDVGLDTLGYNIPNEPLLAALEAKAADLNVVQIAQSVTAIDTAASMATVATDGQEQVAAQLVVAADGQRSSCRDLAGIGMERIETGQVALVCNFSHSEPHDDISTEFHTETGPFTLVPLGQGRSALVWVTDAETAAQAQQLDGESLAELIFDKSHTILGTISVETPVQMFPLVAGVADRLASDRLVLIGEAAHVLPPIGAQGFNMTIRDIDLLVGLARGAEDCGDATVTSRYARERRRDVGRRAQAVTMLNRSLLSDLLPVQLVRGAGMFALGRFAPVRKWLMREGLGIA